MLCHTQILIYSDLGFLCCCWTVIRTWFRRSVVVLFSFLSLALCFRVLGCVRRVSNRWVEPWSKILLSGFWSFRSSGSCCAWADIAHSQFFVSLQNFCRCDFYARADFFTLERSRSSGYSGAQAGSTFWCKFWDGEIHAQADWFSRSSGCVLFLCLGARAYLVFCSWRSSVVFSARAEMSYISWQLGILKSLFTFSLSLSLTF